MADDWAEARKALAHYRKGTQISGACSELYPAVADAIRDAYRRGEAAAIRVHTEAAGKQEIKMCAGRVAKHVEAAFAAQAKLDKIKIEARAIADALGERGLLDIADDVRMLTKL